MAVDLIKAALGTVNSLFQNEVVSFLGVDAEIRRLSSALATIKAVLEDAEEKLLTGEALKDWLRKIRDAAYLLDDVLDEISTHALSLEFQNKVQGSFLYYLNPAHVLFRLEMAKKLKDMSQRLDEIAEERSRFHLSETGHKKRSQVMKWRQTTSIITQPQFYGRDADKEKIVNFLIGDASNSEVVSVYPITGIGGLGKTTLAQQVFNDVRVVHHFELRIWVYVSEDFDLEKLSKAIIESAGSACGDSELEPLQRKLQEVVGRKRYLLVLDDVWNDNQEKWDKLKYVLACGSKGASILVTTRLAKVAYITRTMPPHELSLLSIDDCWKLFKQRAFAQNEERPELEFIGREIVKKCRGVPLAAKTLGSFLCLESDMKEWCNIMESEIWNLPLKEDSILPALRLSYLNLPTKLRRCFAYLAVFPKGMRMRKRQVIELWLANGLISTVGRREVEDDGDRVWNELRLRSFFEDVVKYVEFDYNIYSVDDTWFKMHDLVYDLAQFVMEEECCSCTLGNGPPSERTRHLSFSKDERFHKQWLSHLHKVKSLKTLISLAYDVPYSCDICMIWCHLRALDLWRLKELPSSIGQLKHLRYLNLSHGSFTKLPDSICRLWNLQILKLNSCRELQKLPNQLKCLKSLRHLHLEECVSLSILAPELGQLTCLKTLHVYIVGTQKGFLMEELGNLKLEGTLRIKHLERVTSGMDAQKANLACKRLYNLELSWERNQQSQSQEDEEKILEALQPHTQLKTLRLSGYLGARLPQWVVNPALNDLYCLELDCINLFFISSLAKLPSLKRLRLSNMNSVRYIDNGSYVDGVERGFQALEDLTLERLPSLIMLSREDGDNMFPRLSKLQITHCPQLNLPFLLSVTKLSIIGECRRELLDSIQNLPNLESLDISNDEKVTSFPDEMLGGLKCLKTLDLFWLPKLEAFPTGLANLKALENLTIVGCNNLEMKAEEVLQGLSSLTRLYIYKHPKFELSAGFRHLVCLEYLHIRSCWKVIELHNALQQIMTLRWLYLYDLPNLVSLPHWLGNLRSLESLTIYECPKLKSLPMSTHSLTNLEFLKIRGCPELVKRCKEEIGADWHKIAHVSHRDIQD